MVCREGVVYFALVVLNLVDLALYEGKFFLLREVTFEGGLDVFLRICEGGLSEPREFVLFLFVLACLVKNFIKRLSPGDTFAKPLL